MIRKIYEPKKNPVNDQDSIWIVNSQIFFKSKKCSPSFKNELIKKSLIKFTYSSSLIFSKHGLHILT
jgi:hypothetical protein